MDKLNPLIIAITDEVGSTPRDERLRKDRDKKRLLQSSYKEKFI